MKNNKILLLGALFLLTVGTATATTITINATNDTWIHQGSPNQNYGDTTSMYVRYAPPNTYNSFVIFNLSLIPNGSIINSATLYIYETTGGNLGSVQSLYNITSSWNESNVTWNTKPTVQAQATSSANGIDSVGWMSWAVTDTVRGWFGGRYGSLQNYGFLLNETSGGAFILIYSTRENTTAIPYLSIDYTANSVPIMQTNSIAPLTAYKTDTLTATVSATDADSDSITYAYQWYVGDSPIGGATSSTLSPPTIEGSSYKVLVTPSDSYGSGTGTYSNSIVIQGSSTNYTDYTINYSISDTKVIDACTVASKTGTSCITSSYGDVSITSNGTAVGTQRSYINWSIVEIPQNHSIKLAQLSLLAPIVGFGGNTTNISRVTASWTTNIAWGTQPTTASPESSTSVTTQNTRYTWDITQMFTSWNTGTNPNYGMLIRVNYESPTSYGGSPNIELAINETVYSKGRIDVDIDNYKPYASAFKIDSITNNSLVTNSTPNFTWTPFDGDGDSINRTEIQVWNGSGATGTQFLSYNENSNLTSFVYNGTALTINSTYYVRIRLYDWAGAGNWYEYSFFYGQKPIVNSASVDTTSPTAGNSFTLTFNATSQYGTITDANVTITRDSLTTLTYNYTDSEITKSGDTFTISVTTPTSPVPLIYNVTTIEVKDSNGFTNTSNYTFTITTVAPVVSSGGGGGGGGAPYYPSVTPKTTSQIPIAPGIPLKLQNITSGRTQPESEAIANCLTESLLFPNECSIVGYGIIIEVFSWWVYLGAYIGALLVVGAIAVIKQQKREWQDVLIYGTLTVFIVAILVIVGFNLYIANYIFDSPKYAWTFVSMVGWGTGFSVVVDNYTYKNARKVRMNSWIAKK